MRNSNAKLFKYIVECYRRERCVPVPNRNREDVRSFENVILFVAAFPSVRRRNEKLEGKVRVDLGSSVVTCCF